MADWRAGQMPDVDIRRATPEAAGLLSMALPSPVGDVAGLLSDAWGYAKQPETLTLGRGLLSLAALAPGVPAGLRVFRAGDDVGRTAKAGGPTFYSTKAKGAAPYATHGREVKEHVISPAHVFDTTNLEHRRLYERFMQETGHPARYGGNYPFWTAEPDLKKWLDGNGWKFDAIIFGENTGIPSYAVY